MDADTAQRILVVGLPETGKSSFIQALDEVLKHPANPNDLRSSGLANDRCYIQRGKPEFLAGKKLTRTLLPADDASVELWRRTTSDTTRRLVLRVLAFC